MQPWTGARNNFLRDHLNWTLAKYLTYDQFSVAGYGFCFLKEQINLKSNVKLTISMVWLKASNHPESGYTNLHLLWISGRCQVSSGFRFSSTGFRYSDILSCNKLYSLPKERRSHIWRLMSLLNCTLFPTSPYPNIFFKELTTTVNKSQNKKS